MNLEFINKLKNYVESLDKNISFVSMADEGKFIIKNKATGIFYKLAYDESDNELKISTKNAENYFEDTVTPFDEFVENGQKLYSSMKNIFSSENYDEALDNLSETIRTLPFVEEGITTANVNPAQTVDGKPTFTNIPKGGKTSIGKKPQKQCVCKDGAKCTCGASEEAVEPEEEKTTPLFKMFKNKVAQMEAIENEYIRSFNIFDENNELVKDTVISYYDAKKAYNEAKQEVEEYKQGVKKYIDFVSGFKKLGLNDKIINSIFESVDLFDSANFQTNLSTHLAILKNTFDENFNIVDYVKKIKKFYNETIDPSITTPKTFSASTDDISKPRFLKFNINLYTFDDLRQLTRELENAMSFMGNISPEDLALISNYKMEIDYMVRTGQIADKAVTEIIRMFNEKFSKDRSEEFNSGDSALGFRSIDQMKVNNAQGFAYSTGTPTGTTNTLLAGDDARQSMMSVPETL